MTSKIKFIASFVILVHLGFGSIAQTKSDFDRVEPAFWWVGMKNAPPGRVFARLLAETKGFEPLMQLITAYSLSRGAPSATRSRLREEARF